MTPWLDDRDVQLHQGDAGQVLADMPTGSVDCVVTSPPYWALRDYGDDQQIGLEADPQDYVARLVQVFDSVWHVLADVGTLWLNIGDTYAAKARGSDAGWATSRLTNPGTVQKMQAASMRRTGERHRGRGAGLKEKDLAGIPWRVAFALQDAGWYLRSEIIWSKSNPMPESVTDRPTKAHEQIFLLTKQPRYHYDAAAIIEPHSPDGRRITGRTTGTGSHENHRLADGERRERWPGDGRNARSVWEIATRPFPEAHFATFPEQLVRRCILAGCPAGGVVLDPFIGSGTTALVARQLGRRAIGVDLNEEYLEIAARRLGQQSLLSPALAPAGGFE